MPPTMCSAAGCWAEGTEVDSAHVHRQQHRTPIAWRHYHEDQINHVHPPGYECSENPSAPIETIYEDTPVGAQFASVSLPPGAVLGSAVGLPRVAVTVVNGGEEVNLREMLTEPWMPALAERLYAVLGRKYLAHQLVSILPADLALRMVQRVEEVIDHQVTTAVEQIHQDVDGAVTTTLARLAEEADTKRREITRERYAGHSRLD